MPSSSLPTTPATPTSQLPSFPPHPLTGNVLGSSGSLGAVGSIGSGLSSQAIQKPLSQLGQLPLSTPASSSSGLHSPSFSSSQNPLLQQLHQAGSLGQPMGGAAMDNARLLAGLGIQKQLGGSSLLQQQQQQSALLSQSRNQAEKLRTGNFEYHSLCIQWAYQKSELASWTGHLENEMLVFSWKCLLNPTTGMLTRYSLPTDVLWGSFVMHSFLPHRNECVTNEPQKMSAGRLY